MLKPHDQLSEKTSETGIVASLAASPLYRERSASAFDLATTSLEVMLRGTCGRTRLLDLVCTTTIIFPGGEE